MRNQSTLYVTFHDHQVSIHSNVSEVLTEVEREFREMIEFKPNKIIGGLEVIRRNHQYYFRKIGQHNSNVIVKRSSLTEILCCLKSEVLATLIETRKEFLWLHAGAAAYQGYAVLFSGASGRGKSTLVTSLCARSCTYLSDDLIPLDLNSSQLIPFPQTPRIRKNIGQELSSEEVEKLKKTEVILKPETICRETMPIGTIVFPTYSLRTPADLIPYSPAAAALELLQNCINLGIHRQAAMRCISEVLNRLPTFRLFFSNSNLAAELIIDTLEKNNLYSNPNYED